MVHIPKAYSAPILRLILGLAPLGWPQPGNAVGVWSVIPLPAQPSDGLVAEWLAVDAAGSLYTAEVGDAPVYPARIRKLDGQGNWTLIAPNGTSVGQVHQIHALAVDSSGNLYVADEGADGGRLQKSDAQGRWSVIATLGSDLGQVNNPTGLAVDRVGNLYVADSGNNRVLKYTPAP